MKLLVEKVPFTVIDYDLKNNYNVKGTLKTIYNNFYYDWNDPESTVCYKVTGEKYGVNTLKNAIDLGLDDALLLIVPKQQHFIYNTVNLGNTIICNNETSLYHWGTVSDYCPDTSFFSVLTKGEVVNDWKNAPYVYAVRFNDLFKKQPKYTYTIRGKRDKNIEGLFQSFLVRGKLMNATNPRYLTIYIPEYGSFRYRNYLVNHDFLVGTGEQIHDIVDKSGYFVKNARNSLQNRAKKYARQKVYDEIKNYNYGALLDEIHTTGKCAESVWLKLANNKTFMSNPKQKIAVYHALQVIAGDIINSNEYTQTYINKWIEKGADSLPENVTLSSVLTTLKNAKQEINRYYRSGVSHAYICSNTPAEVSAEVD